MQTHVNTLQCITVQIEAQGKKEESDITGQMQIEKCVSAAHKNAYRMHAYLQVDVQFLV